MGQDHGQELLAALRQLLHASNTARADDLPAIVRVAGYEFGASFAVLYVVDYDQVQLVPLLEADPQAEEKLLMTRAPLPVEGTLAGRCFTDVTVQSSAGAVPSSSGCSIWAPVLDGTDRLGVLELVFDEEIELDEELVTDVALLAALIAELQMSRSLIGDFIERERRRLPMLLEAELQWNLLPPLTFASPVVSIAGVLAPTNEVAGDSFDYAVNGEIAHLCIVDAMGHGLDATLDVCRGDRRAAQCPTLGPGPGRHHPVDEQARRRAVRGVEVRHGDRRGAGHRAPGCGAGSTPATRPR